MENASKALLLAGSVLIGVMVLALAVYLFSNFAGSSQEIHQNIEDNQIAQFNNQFTQYVGNTNVTIHNIVSMANLATQNNWYYEMPYQTATGKNNYITILCNGVSIEFGFRANQTEEQRISEMENRYNTLISNDVNQITSTNDLPQYTVQVETSEITHRVYKVICRKIT